MMGDKFSKVLKIIEKTGDKCIVYLPEHDEAFVVMGLSEYEKTLKSNTLGNLTEDELLNKINKDIAVWKSEQNTSVYNPMPEASPKLQDKPNKTDEKYYFEPVEESEENQPKIS